MKRLLFIIVFFACHSLAIAEDKIGFAIGSGNDGLIMLSVRYYHDDKYYFGVNTNNYLMNSDLTLTIPYVGYRQHIARGFSLYSEVGGIFLRHPSFAAGASYYFNETFNIALGYSNYFGYTQGSYTEIPGYAFPKHQLYYSLELRW
ncbi:MAG: hypothetical protein OEZ43_20735 [Gammaproteobacteria bacterium]|nr:hypothetical protein [Gammaproteobacteria bacterium]